MTMITIKRAVQRHTPEIPNNAFMNRMTHLHRIAPCEMQRRIPATACQGAAAPASFLHGVPRALLRELLAALQQVAALEVGVGVHDGLAVGDGPRALVLGAADLGTVRPVEDAVARDVVLAVADVVAHALQHLAVAHAHPLQHRHQVVRLELLVGAAVVLVLGRRQVLGQDALARVRRVAAAAAVGVAADLAVGVAHVVAVVAVELVVGHVAEGAPPVRQAVVERQADALEEQRVL